MLTGKRLQLIAVAKKRLAMVDEDYRGLLLEYGGVTSARDLDERGFDAVMARFRFLGFTSDHYKAGFGARIGMATPHQLKLIRTLWLAAVDEPTPAHFRNWLTKQFKISDARFIDDKTARKVITALRTMAARRNVKASVGASAT